MKEEFIKHDNSGAIINTDNNGLALYKKRKKKFKSDSKRIEKLENSLEKLNNKIDIILDKLR